MLRLPCSLCIESLLRGTIRPQARLKPSKFSELRTVLQKWIILPCVGAWQQHAVSRKHDGSGKREATHFRDVLFYDGGGFQHAQPSTLCSSTGTLRTACGVRVSFLRTGVFRGWQRTVLDFCALPSSVCNNFTQSSICTKDSHNKWAITLSTRDCRTHFAPSLSVRPSASGQTSSPFLSTYGARGCHGDPPAAHHTHPVVVADEACASCCPDNCAAITRIPRINQLAHGMRTTTLFPQSPKTDQSYTWTHLSKQRRSLSPRSTRILRTRYPLTCNNLSRCATRLSQHGQYLVPIFRPSNFPHVTGDGTPHSVNS